MRKYQRKFSGEILCGALWGVNLLVGTNNGLLLLDRSGNGKGGFYSVLYRIAGKFGGLTACLCNCQIKIHQYIFTIAIWDPTAKFSSHQYFRLYGT